MAIENPLWMQANAYSARLDRGLIAAIFTEGVINGIDVTQRGAGANASVDIAIGRAIIQGDDQANQGCYLFVNTSVFNLTGFAAAPGTGERFDLVYARVNDPNAGGPAGSNGAFGIVTGTAAAVGSAVIPTLPSSAIPLATVRWTPGVGSVVTSMIVNRKVPAVAYGGDPIGSILHFSAPEATLDARYVICDGRAISRTTYATYFAAVSTTYGSGDGTSTFNVPDLRGRTIFGLDNQGGTAANRLTGVTTLGAAGGAATRTLTLTELPSHSHTVNSHSHGGQTGDISQNHLHDLQNHAHYTSNVTDVQGTHHHNPASVFTFVTSGFAANLDVHDGGGAFGYDTVGTTSDDGGHQHNWGNWSGGPNVNNTGWADRGHVHSIGAEAPGTSAVGSGAAFSIMNPYVAMILAVRAI